MSIVLFEKICSKCGKEGNYIATDVRPVFPEENMLVSILVSQDPFKFQKDSVWYGSNSYIVNGVKIKLSISNANNKSIAEIFQIKQLFEINKNKITYKFFDSYKNIFIELNKGRFDEITEEATREIQKYKDRYPLDDMMISFSGGKDSTVTSHLVRTALGSNDILHVFGDTTFH